MMRMMCSLGEMGRELLPKFEGVYALELYEFSSEYVN